MQQPALPIPMFAARTPAPMPQGQQSAQQAGMTQPSGNPLAGQANRGALPPGGPIAPPVNQLAPAPKAQPEPQCVATQYKGIVLRKTDNKYLALLQLPVPVGAENQEAQWVTLGQFDRAQDAIAMQDCMTIAIHSNRKPLIRPASTYQVDAIVKAMIQAHEFGSNHEWITSHMVVHCVQNALVARVPFDKKVMSSVQSLMQTLAIHVAMKKRTSALPAARPAAAAAAQPPRPPVAAASPAAQPSAAGQARPAGGASDPVSQLVVAAAAVLNQAQAMAPKANDAAGAQGRLQQGVHAWPTAGMPWQGAAAAAGQPAKPGTPGSGAAGPSGQPAQGSLPGGAAAPNGQGGGTPGSGVTISTRPMGLQPGAPNAQGEKKDPATDPNLAHIHKLLTTVLAGQAQRLSDQGAAARAAGQAAKAAGLAGRATGQPARTTGQAANASAALKAAVAAVAARPAIPAKPAGMDPLQAQASLQQFLTVLRNSQLPTQPTLPGASRMGTGDLKPTGVTLMTTGQWQGKWEVKHKFFTPKGSAYCNLTLGYYDTEEQAISVHDCAALAVPGSFLYRAPSTYTLSQVLTVVKNITSHSTYTNGEEIVKIAQAQALKSQVRHMLPQSMMPRPPPPPAPPAPDRILFVLQLVDRDQPSERVRVQLIVFPGAQQAADVPEFKASPLLPSRPVLKYKPSPRQNLQHTAVQDMLKGASPTSARALEVAVEQASTYHGVQAILDNGVIKFMSKVPMNMSTWTTGEHNTAEGAARAHDATAIGIFGREAMPFLNFGNKLSPQFPTGTEVHQAMENLATKYPWVRKKHMEHLADCAAECGITIPGLPPSQPGSRMLSLHGLPGVNGAGGSSSQEPSPRGGAPSGPPVIPVGVPTPILLDPNDKFGSKQATKDATLAKATSFIGVWRETAGPLRGTFSAKQSGPTGHKGSPNTYMVVGYYRTEVEAARARDMAAISMQTNPRLNFPADTYTKEMIMEVAVQLIARNGSSLTNSIDKHVEGNVRRWEARVVQATGRLPGHPGLKVTIQLGDAVELQLTLRVAADSDSNSMEIDEGAGAAVPAVSVRLVVVPRVTVNIALPDRAGKVGKPPAGGPMGARIPGLARGAAATGSNPNLKLALGRAPSGTSAGTANASKDEEDEEGAQARRVRRKPNRTQGADDMEEDSEGPSTSSSHGSDVDMSGNVDTAGGSSGGGAQTDRGSPAEPAGGGGAAAAGMLMLEDKEAEEQRRAAKKLQGVTPSGLAPTDENYFGVQKEQAGPGQPVMYTAKSGLTIKDGRGMYLVVGRCEDEEEAARLRDLGAMSLGTAAQPRLNFDADQYTLSEVELFLHTLVEDYPRHFTMAMLPGAIKNAQKHGVKNDLPPTHEINQVTSGAGGGRGKASAAARARRAAEAAADAGLQRTGWPGARAMDYGMDVDRGVEQGRGRGRSDGSQDGAASVPISRKRVRSPEEEEEAAVEEGPQDYVRVRMNVVPLVRLHLMVDHAPVSHRPPLRAVIQVVSGVELGLSVGARPKKSRQGTGPSFSSDLLLMLAEAAVHTGDLPAGPGYREDTGRAAGQKRGRDASYSLALGEPGHAGGNTLSQLMAEGGVQIGPGNSKELIHVTEQMFFQLTRENEHIVRKALQRLGARVPTVMPSPPRQQQQQPTAAGWVPPRAMLARPAPAGVASGTAAMGSARGRVGGQRQQMLSQHQAQAQQQQQAVPMEEGGGAQGTRKRARDSLEGQQQPGQALVSARRSSRSPAPRSNHGGGVSDDDRAGADSGSDEDGQQPRHPSSRAQGQKLLDRRDRHPASTVEAAMQAAARSARDEPPRQARPVPGSDPISRGNQLLQAAGGPHAQSGAGIAQQQRFSAQKQQVPVAPHAFQARMQPRTSLNAGRGGMPGRGGGRGAGAGGSAPNGNRGPVVIEISDEDSEPPKEEEEDEEQAPVGKVKGLAPAAYQNHLMQHVMQRQGSGTARAAPAQGDGEQQAGSGRAAAPSSGGQQSALDSPRPSHGARAGMVNPANRAMAGSKGVAVGAGLSPDSQQRQQQRQAAQLQQGQQQMQVQQQMHPQQPQQQRVLLGPSSQGQPQHMMVNHAGMQGQPMQMVWTPQGMMLAPMYTTTLPSSGIIVHQGPSGGQGMVANGGMQTYMQPMQGMIMQPQRVRQMAPQGGGVQLMQMGPGGPQRVQKLQRVEYVQDVGAAQRVVTRNPGPQQ